MRYLLQSRASVTTCVIVICEMKDCAVLPVRLSVVYETAHIKEAVRISGSVHRIVDGPAIKSWWILTCSSHSRPYVVNSFNDGCEIPFDSEKGREGVPCRFHTLIIIYRQLYRSCRTNVRDKKKRWYLSRNGRPCFPMHGKRRRKKPNVTPPPEKPFLPVY